MLYKRGLMTVRTWFTISAIALVALAVAVGIRFFAVPVAAPETTVRSGDIRLDGRTTKSCWPQRSGDLRCTSGDDQPDVTPIERKGTLRLFVRFVGQPEKGDGTITITDSDGDRVLRKSWDDAVKYDLDPGTYTLRTHAEYPPKAYVDSVFRLRVER